ncbi:TPA: hypothetical protein EYN23_16340 [Candidatus Poribacteria bacterium]|nr:hypothetical protein [Candidatus Poribacteria bacterium]
MIKHLFFYYQLLALFFLLNGCIVSRNYYGTWAFNRSEYNEAAFNLSAAVRDEPNNQLAWQQLGISYYNLGKYEESRLALSRAFGLDRTDIKAGAYLTSIGYRLRDYQLVKETADQILPYIDSVRIRQIIDFYLLELMSEKRQQDIKIMISDQVEVDGQLIAVMPIADLVGNWRSAEVSSSLSYLMSELFANPQKTDFLVVQDVARKIAPDENLVDITLGAEIANRMGAGSAVIGTLMQTKHENQFQLNLTLVKAEIGQIREFDLIIGTEVDLAKQVKNLTDTIAGKSDNRSILTLLDFAKGRYHLDRGEYSKAIQKFRRASTRSVGFSRARTFLEQTRKLVKYQKKFQKKINAGKIVEQRERILSDRQKLLRTMDLHFEPPTVRGNGDQRFPGTDIPIRVELQ